MPKIIIPHNMPQRVHPSLQTTINQLPKARYIVIPENTIRRIPLLHVRAMQDHIQVDQGEVTESLLCARSAECIEGRVVLLQLRLKHHDASWRECFRDDDFAVRTFVVKALRYDDRSHFVQARRKPLEQFRVVWVIVGQDIQAGAKNEFGFSTTKFNWVNCSDRTRQ